MNFEPKKNFNNQSYTRVISGPEFTIFMTCGEKDSWRMTKEFYTQNVRMV